MRVGLKRPKGGGVGILAELLRDDTDASPEKVDQKGFLRLGIVRCLITQVEDRIVRVELEEWLQFQVLVVRLALPYERDILCRLVDRDLYVAKIFPITFSFLIAQHLHLVH